MKNRFTALAIAATIVVTGCANMTETQRGTATGAGIGAGIGGILGAKGGSGSNTRTATGAIVGGAAGAIIGNIWSSRMEAQKRRMEQATQGTGVQVSQTQDNRLKLDIPSDISFDTNRSDITPNFRPILDRFAASLNEHPNTTVTIVGHTDNTGSNAINDPLSISRAARTSDYLVSRGVSPNRFMIDGRGSYEPIVSNDSAANRARNRRVEIFVAESQATAQAPVYQQQQPVYQQQQPVYQQQQPVYQQQQPMYQQQQPVYQQPPVYQQQPPVYQQPQRY